MNIKRFPSIPYNLKIKGQFIEVKFQCKKFKINTSIKFYRPFLNYIFLVLCVNGVVIISFFS